MSEQAKTLSAEPIYTYFFEDGTTCTIYKDCIKFETDGQCVIREPKSWHSLGWDDKPAYVPSGPHDVVPLKLAEIRECFEFWQHYSSMNEPAQDDIADEKNAMLARMQGWCYYGRDISARLEEGK